MLKHIFLTLNIALLFSLQTVSCMEVSDRICAYMFFKEYKKEELPKGITPLNFDNLPEVVHTNTPRTPRRSSRISPNNHRTILQKLGLLPIAPYTIPQYPEAIRTARL